MRYNNYKNVFRDQSFNLTSDILSGNYTPTTEGYVGKTKELIAAEKEFRKLKHRYFGENFMNDFSKSFFMSLSDDLNKSQEIMKVSELFRKLFKFKECRIFINRSFRYGANAFTYPGSYLVRNSNYGMPKFPTYHGHRFEDKRHEYCCGAVLTIELFNILEPDEIIAILLHEVGHCFDFTMGAYYLEILGWIMMFSTLHPSIIMSKLIDCIPSLRMFFLDITTEISNLAIITVLLNIQGTILRYLRMAWGPLGKLSIIATNGLSILANPVNAFNNLMGTTREQFADSFCAAYGYGPSLISALDKLEKYCNTLSSNSKNSNIVLNNLADTWTTLFNAPINFLMSLVDPHPETQTRCRMIADIMKKTANDPTMPKNMRSAVKANYERCEESYRNYVDTDADGYYMSTKIRRKISDKLFNGKTDWRSLFFGMTNVATNNRYY